GAAVGNPILLAAHAATGDKAWFGWPSDAKHEELRNKWASAETLEERKAVARQLQENAWNFVPQLYYGEWIQPAAIRNSVKAVIPVPEIIQWWNAENTAETSVTRGRTGRRACRGSHAAPSSGAGSPPPRWGPLLPSCGPSRAPPPRAPCVRSSTATSRPTTRS